MNFDRSAAGAVRKAAADVIERYHLPGISIGVVSGDELVFSEGFGFGDIESREVMDPARRQRIASITKTMAGLCTMALLDEGKLSLDDRVVALLPEVRCEGPAERMTVRHLLLHTAGIGEAPTPAALAATIDPNHEGGAGDFSTLYPRGIIIEAEPGTKWAYANHGYALLGEIIARAEQAPLTDVMRSRIFEPLGMTDSECSRNPHPDLTTGYHRAPDAGTKELLERAGMMRPDEPTVDGFNIRGKAVANDHHGMLAAGAVQSTVPDMARYASALLRRGGGIVKPETFDAMVAPQWCPDDRLLNRGFSFARSNRGGRRSFGHGGSYFGGWNSHLAVMPAENMAVIIHMNVMLDNSAPVFAIIERAVFGDPVPTPPSLPLDVDVLAAAPGVFECTPGKLTNFRPSTNYGRIHIASDGRGLTIRARRGVWKEAVPLLPADAADPLLFAACAPRSDPALVLFTRDATGCIDGIRFGDLCHMVRNDQIEPWA